MIAFTQYVLPHGERRALTFEASADVEALAGELVAAGYRFECEILRNGMVNVDCCGPALDGGGDQCLAMELCMNGPAVVGAVDRMVRSAYDAWKGARP